MIVVTSDFISDKKLETLGLVKGSTINSKNFVKDIGQGLKHLIGGELRSYTKMMDEARDEALKRMIKEAESLNADAIISLRFATSSVMSGAAEVIAYGTAVKYI